jgi:hypothetical protein
VCSRALTAVAGTTSGELDVGRPGDYLITIGDAELKYAMPVRSQANICK